MYTPKLEQSKPTEVKLKVGVDMKLVGQRKATLTDT